MPDTRKESDSLGIVAGDDGALGRAVQDFGPPTAARTSCARCSFAAIRAASSCTTC